MVRWSLFLFFFLSFLWADEITVDLNDPVHKRGTLSTDKGGVITTKAMRIQAKHLQYKEERGGKTLFARGDLLLVYHKKFFVGDSFEYNFTTGFGKVTNGVTNLDGVFVGGKTILFGPDGILSVCDAFGTTCDGMHADWSIRAGELHLNNDNEFKATNVTFNLYENRIFWLPSYSMSGRKDDLWDSVAKFRIYKEGGQGLLFMVRYRLWDYEGLKIYWRGEYRIARGLGTAVEMDYTSPSKRQNIQTRNFYAYDTFYNDNNPKKYKNRYRLQGIVDGKNEDGRLEAFGRWDVLSDKNMRQDFPTQLFELATLERTEAFVKSRYDPAFTTIYGRPRVNTFRGFKQELPTFKIALKPYVLSQSGIIFENYLNVSYLDYVYADNLKGEVPDFHSGRLETHQYLYRPLHIGSLNMTPSVGFNGIYYSNNPQKNSTDQAVFEYNLESHATFFREYPYFTHYIKPYFDFAGLTKPTASPQDLYIFSIEDGFYTLNEIHLGLHNSLYQRDWSMLTPRVGCNLYTYGYLGHTTLKPFSNVACDLTWSFPKLILSSRLNWNLVKNQWDYTNFNLSWTLNENFAFSASLLYRGSYDWRKNDHMNNILNVSHTFDELAHSPLSDKRTIFFTRWQIRLAPLWTLSVQNHLGWRPHQPFYHESQFNLHTIISNCLKLRFTYMRTARNNEFSFGLTLI